MLLLLLVLFSNITIMSCNCVQPHVMAIYVTICLIHYCYHHDDHDWYDHHHYIAVTTIMIIIVSIGVGVAIVAPAPVPACSPAGPACCCVASSGNTDDGSLAWLGSMGLEGGLGARAGRSAVPSRRHTGHKNSPCLRSSRSAFSRSSTCGILTAILQYRYMLMLSPLPCRQMRTTHAMLHYRYRLRLCTVPC